MCRSGVSRGVNMALDESTNHNFSQQQASPKYRPPPLSTLEMSQQSFVSLELAAQCPELVNYSSLLDVHRTSHFACGCGVLRCLPLLPTTTASRAATAPTTPTRGSTATSSGSWRGCLSAPGVTGRCALKILGLFGVSYIPPPECHCQ